MKIKSYFNRMTPSMIVVTIVGLIGSILILSPKMMMIYIPNNEQLNLMKEAQLYYKGDSNNILEYSKYILSDDQLTERRYFFTAQLVFLKFAVIVNQLLYSSTEFDIRFLGMTYLGFYLCGLYWLTKVVFPRNTKPKNRIEALFLGLVAAILGGLRYFNSFYNFPVTLITIIYITAACFNLIRLNRVKFEGIFISLLISTSLLVTNDFKNWWMAGIFFILLSVIVWMRLSDAKKRMYFIASAFLMMIISGWATYHFNNPKNLAVPQNKVQLKNKLSKLPPNKNDF